VIRRRLEASVMPVCPECGSKNTKDSEVSFLSTVYQCTDCKVFFYTEKSGETH